ncbi:trypsin-like serine protease [Polychaeton citri CBS 116435]|uniref:Trypsin-like serine protease n=1 Tax=Polychaeton citri CBS 116435 TaxID=1314669 RepID=A0A9P4Q9N1_9PEZI|nr:trypsin-like serine protease [Polychaeton citri CBS 116435]
MANTRITRSGAKKTEILRKLETVDIIDNTGIGLQNPDSTINASGSILQPVLTVDSTGLSKADLDLLLLKQGRLRSSNAQVTVLSQDLSGSQKKSSLLLADAALGTFVFAQEEAGTAVCISPDGVLLTCSHCVAGSSKQAKGAVRWLVSASGEAIEATCIAWDAFRDLALLRVITKNEPSLESEKTKPTASRFPFGRVASMSPLVNAKLICIGHPGSEDLEASEEGIETGYDVLHISRGRFRGHQPDQDLQDNSEIGCLQHDCWTYWGHSGAPLIEQSSGEIVGLHSSWDDETGMRRGVPLEAIAVFLTNHRHLLGMVIEP